MATSCNKNNVTPKKVVYIYNIVEDGETTKVANTDKVTYKDLCFFQRDGDKI